METIKWIIFLFTTNLISGQKVMHWVHVSRQNDTRISTRRMCTKRMCTKRMCTRRMRTRRKCTRQSVTFGEERANLQESKGINLLFRRTRKKSGCVPSEGINNKKVSTSISRKIIKLGKKGKIK